MEISTFDSLFAVLKEHHDRHEKSATITPDFYSPGNMENLDQYDGFSDETNRTITLSTPVKGLRYEGRSFYAEELSVGDPVRIEREPSNTFNPSCIQVIDKGNRVIGYLSDDLNNTLAPLLDTGVAQVRSGSVSYLEKLSKRSRYAVTAIVFVKIVIKIL